MGEWDSEPVNTKENRQLGWWKAARPRRPTVHCL
jgi:hypothetical protein